MPDIFRRSNEPQACSYSDQPCKIHKVILCLVSPDLKMKRSTPRPRIGKLAAPPHVVGIVPVVIDGRRGGQRPAKIHFQRNHAESASERPAVGAGSPRIVIAIEEVCLRALPTAGLAKINSLGNCLCRNGFRFPRLCAPPLLFRQKPKLRSSIPLHRSQSNHNF